MKNYRDQIEILATNLAGQDQSNDIDGFITILSLLQDKYRESADEIAIRTEILHTSLQRGHFQEDRLTVLRGLAEVYPVNLENGHHSFSQYADMYLKLRQSEQFDHNRAIKALKDMMNDLINAARSNH